MEGPRYSDKITQAIFPSGSVFKYYNPELFPRDNLIQEIYCSNGQILKPDFSNIPLSLTIRSPLNPTVLTAYHEAGHALIALKFPPELCELHEINIRDENTNLGVSHGYTLVRHLGMQVPGIFEISFLQAFGGVAAQQYLANQGKLPREKIFLGIDGDFQTIEKMAIQKHKWNEVDLNKVFKAACNIITQHKELFEKLVGKINSKLTLEKVDIDQFLRENSELVDNLRNPNS
ncbi:MAG: hypothetical protein ACQBVK_01520 [Candidatus Phytoplasma sp. TWB_XP]